MSVEHRGNPGTALVPQPGYPIKRQGFDTKFELEFLYWADMDVAESLVPAINTTLASSSLPDKSAPAAAGHGGLFCNEIEWATSDTPERQFVRVIFRDPSTVLQTPIFNTRESNTSAFEVPIEEKTALSASQVTEKKAAGRRTYTVNTVEYRYVRYRNTFTFSEKNMTAGVGLIDNSPTGMSNPTPGRWKKTGRNVRKAGANVEVTDIWQYDTNGWDIDLYGPAVL